MSSVESVANNNGNPTVCGINQDKLYHLARQSNLASPEFPVINPPFNYNSCVTKFKTKLQKVTRTIMKPKVPCVMLSFYQAACHLIIARSQSVRTTLLPGTLVHFVVGTAQSVSWLSFLLWVMDSSPEPGISSFFCQYEEEAMRITLILITFYLSYPLVSSPSPDYK